jgi:biotin carboxyl carrier protein
MVEKRRVTVDGEELEVEMEFDGGRWEVSVGGRTFSITTDSSHRIQKRKRVARSEKKIGFSGSISSAIPGKIVSVLVTEGDKVSEGEVVIVLEAMKMQNEIKAVVNGMVRKVNCETGEKVEANVPLIEIESLSEGSE